MKIVLFGYRFHPYTLDIISELNKENVQVDSLIQAKPKYTFSQAYNSRDLDLDSLDSVKVSNFLSPWVFKEAIINPKMALSMFNKLLSSKLSKRHKRKRSTHHEISLVNSNIYDVDTHNSKNCEELLKSIKPDLLILGPASSIIRNNILSIPKIGTINGHMGLLPEYRGMNAEEWTYYHTGKAYVTIHHVDEGLDTGDIISLSEINTKGMNSLAQMRFIGRKQMAKDLVKSVSLLSDRSFLPKKQQINEGKQFFEMHPIFVDIIEKRLKESNCYMKN